MTVTVYSTATCPYCKMLKDYLDERRIVYSEKLVDRDEKALQEMSEVSNGFLGVPFTVITLDNGTKENVLGFDKGKINKVLQVDQV